MTASEEHRKSVSKSLLIMDLSELKYIKEDGKRMPEEEKSENTDDFTEENLSGIKSSVSKDYQKAMPVVPVTQIFTISGGTERERKYIEQFKNSKRVTLVFISKKGTGMIPEEMRKTTQESIHNEYFDDYQGQRRYYLDGDKIFLLQDVDHYGLELQQFYKEDGKNENYKWIISNPCFEIWLYYHYYQETDQLSECKNIEIIKRSAWLKKKLNDIVNGGINPGNLIDKMCTAINNSQNNLIKDKDDFPDLFMTEMYLVAKAIKDAMKDELADLIKKKTVEIRKRKEKFQL